jgi:hypothetical protein
MKKRLEVLLTTQNSTQDASELLVGNRFGWMTNLTKNWPAAHLGMHSQKNCTCCKWRWRGGNQTSWWPTVADGPHAPPPTRSPAFGPALGWSKLTRLWARDSMLGIDASSTKTSHCPPAKPGMYGVHHLFFSAIIGSNWKSQRWWWRWFPFLPFKMLHTLHNYYEVCPLFSLVCAAY